MTDTPNPGTDGGPPLASDGGRVASVNRVDDAAIADAILGDGGEFFSAPDAISPHPRGDGGPQETGDNDDHQVDDVPPADDPPDDIADLAEVLSKCAIEPQNDTGNGQRLLYHFGRDLLWVRKVGCHVWCGTHWIGDGGDEAAVRHAQQTAARIAFEAAFMEHSLTEVAAIRAANDHEKDFNTLNGTADRTDEQNQRLRTLRGIMDAGDAARAALIGRKGARRKYAISSGNAGKISGMIAQALPHKTVVPDALNPDKLAFNVRNGTLRFVSRAVDDPDGTEASGFKKTEWHVRLDPHDRSDLITKLAPVIYDPDATAPTFIRDIERFQPIVPTRAFLQRYHGYAMTGQIGEQCLVFNYGTGSNWKSTFVEVCCRAMGDYAATLNFESLAGDAQKSGSQASPDLARLPGARLVRASEPERGVQFKESLVKSLTGGEPMLVRHNFKDFFEFTPDFKLTLSGNHKPEIGGVDHGIWRRMRFVNWPVTIKDDEKRPFGEVIDELWQESSGILNWLIEGCLDYLNGGLRTPQEVIDATAAYREEMDPVGNFLGDCVTAVAPHPDGGPASTVYAREMFQAFSAWGHHNAVRPWKEKSFATAMSQKGFEKDKTRDGHRYLHVRLHDIPAAPRGRHPNDPPHPAENEEVPV